MLGSQVGVKHWRRLFAGSASRSTCHSALSVQQEVTGDNPPVCFWLFFFFLSYITRASPRTTPPPPPAPPHAIFHTMYPHLWGKQHITYVIIYFVPAKISLTLFIFVPSGVRIHKWLWTLTPEGSRNSRKCSMCLIRFLSTTKKTKKNVSQCWQQEVDRALYWSLKSCINAAAVTSCVFSRVYCYHSDHAPPSIILTDQP